MRATWWTKGLSRLPFAPKGEPLSLELAVEEKTALARARFREGVELAFGVPGGKDAPVLRLKVDFQEKRAEVGFPGPHPERFALWQRREGFWEASPGAFVPWEGLQDASFLLYRAVELLSPLARSRRGRLGEAVRRTAERAERLLRLLEKADEGGLGSYAVPPFGGKATGDGLVLWNTELHPFAKALELIPEGGPYRGPLPRYPGAYLEAEVRSVALMGHGTRLVLRALRVGPLVLPGGGGEAELFPGGPGLAEEVLRAFGVPEEVWPLLKKRKGEEAARAIALRKIGET